MKQRVLARINAYMLKTHPHYTPTPTPLGGLLLIGRSKQLACTVPGAPHTLAHPPTPSLAPRVLQAAQDLRQRVASDAAHWLPLLLQVLGDVGADEGRLSSFAAVILYDLMGAHPGEQACRAALLSSDGVGVFEALLEGCMQDAQGIRKYSLAALALLLRDAQGMMASNQALGVRLYKVLHDLAHRVGGLKADVQCLVLEVIYWAALAVPGGPGGMDEVVALIKGWGGGAQDEGVESLVLLVVSQQR